MSWAGTRLRSVLEKLNPELPAKALDAAKEELTRDRSALSLVEGNREIDKLLCGGVKVTIMEAEIREIDSVDGWRCYEHTGRTFTYDLEWKVGPESQNQ